MYRLSLTPYGFFFAGSTSPGGSDNENNQSVRPPSTNTIVVPESPGYGFNNQQSQNDINTMDYHLVYSCSVQT